MRRVVVTGMGIACPLGLGVERVWQRLISSELGISAIQAFRCERSAMQGRRPGSPGCAGYRRAGHQRVDPGEGPEEDGSVHPSRHGRGQRSGGRFRLDAGSRGRSLRHGRDDRLRHRRASDDLRGIDPGVRRSRAPAVAVLHPIRADQPRVGPCLDQIRLQGTESFGGDGLRHRRACDRRCVAADHAGDADVMVAGGTEAAVCELGIAGFCASRALSTGFNDRPPAHRGHGTRIVTAL